MPYLVISINLHRRLAGRVVDEPAIQDAELAGLRRREREPDPAAGDPRQRGGDERIIEVADRAPPPPSPAERQISTFAASYAAKLPCHSRWSSARLSQAPASGAIVDDQ